MPTLGHVTPISSSESSASGRADRPPVTEKRPLRPGQRPLQLGERPLQLDRGAARAVRWRVWGPLALRALALGLALLGLAGIGSVASRATPSGAAVVAVAPAVSQAGIDLLLTPTLASLGGTPAAAEPSRSAPRARAASEPKQQQPGQQEGRDQPGQQEPEQGAAPSPAPAQPCSLGPDDERKARPSRPADAHHRSPVAINRAGAAELQRLPGVGPRRAEAILQLRQRLGRFRRPADLLRIKGIGPRTLERMLPHLELD